MDITFKPEQFNSLPEGTEVSFMEISCRIMGEPANGRYFADGVCPPVGTIVGMQITGEKDGVLTLQLVPLISASGVPEHRPAGPLETYHSRNPNIKD